MVVQLLIVGYPGPDGDFRFVIGHWPNTLTQACIVKDRGFIENFVAAEFELTLTQAQRDKFWDYISEQLWWDENRVFRDGPWGDDCWRCWLKVHLMQCALIPGPGRNQAAEPVEIATPPAYVHLGVARSRIFSVPDYLRPINIVAARVGGADLPHSY